MQLNLTDEQANTLREILESYLPEVRMEAARTDLPARELLHNLMRRRDLCERLISDIEGFSASANAFTGAPAI
jgi:hypothetical protein